MEQSVAQLAIDVAAGRRLGGSIYARSTLAKGAFASKVYHTFKLQAPAASVRHNVFKGLQGTLNTLVFGKYYEVRVDTAQQPSRDAGIGHVDIARRMRADRVGLAREPPSRRRACGMEKHLVAPPA